METTATRNGDSWRISGEKTWNTGIHAAPYDLILARASGQAGGHGITAFLVSTDSPGRSVPVVPGVALQCHWASSTVMSSGP